MGLLGEMMLDGVLGEESLGGVLAPEPSFLFKIVSFPHHECTGTELGSGRKHVPRV